MESAEKQSEKFFAAQRKTRTDIGSLREEGLCLRAAVPQKKNVQTFAFENLDFAVAFFRGTKPKIAPTHGSLVQRELPRSG